jgi:hypothetical protein
MPQSARFDKPKRRLAPWAVDGVRCGMAIDTPARLAILGAGPIGLEAALYARFLGYEVVIYERGQVAEHVRQWGHVRMLAPFSQCCTPLGLAALQAQDPSWQAPSPDAHLTGHEWVARYLEPLAHSDLVEEHLRLGTTVLAVGKEELLKEDLPCGQERGDFAFRVLSRGPEGTERIERFDGVLDCTGVWSTPRWLGHGGIPAVGELALADQIEHRLPDILGRDRAQYAGRHTLLVGAGMAAATNLVALVALADQVPGTRITWVTRREGPAGGGPIPVRPDDPWPQRAALARQANELARQAACVEHLPLAMVEEVRQIAPEGPLEVVLSGPAGRTLRVDRILANVGFRPDETLAMELQVAPSPCGWGLRLWPGGPPAWPAPDGASLQGDAGHVASAGNVASAGDVASEAYVASPGDVGSAANVASEALSHMQRDLAGTSAPALHCWGEVQEMHYYVLGARSAGRCGDFTLRGGYEQIRRVFARIGDRADLDLYAGAQRLVR